MQNIEIRQIVVSTIDIFGLVQGLIFGIFLIVIHKDYNKSTFFLGVFIIMYSLGIFPEIVFRLELDKYYPSLAFLPLDFVWLEFALFYIYVQKVSIFPQKKLNYVILYPGLLHLVFQIIILFLTEPIRTLISDSLWYDIILWFFGFIYSIVIGVNTIKLISKHIKEVGNQYSSVTLLELRWARQFVMFGLLLILFSFIAEIFTDSWIANLTFSSINVILLYWISLRGIRQKNVVPLVIYDNNQFENSSKTQIDKDIYKKTVFDADSYILKSQIFLEPDLTISQVASALNVHTKLLSTSINYIKNKNFNTYINQFRIEKAKALLQNDNYRHFTIEGVGMEVGFSSNSSFYTAFKKICGMTPRLYKGQCKKTTFKD